MSQRLIIILLIVASVAIADTPEKVILDTDSGPFNDDGVALVMLLQSPARVSLLGITVVPGNVWPMQGAEYMLAHTVMMHRSGLPVFIGAAAPLLHTPAIAAAAAEKFGKQNYIGAFAEQPARTRADLKKPFYGFSGLTPQKQSAVDFIIATIERNPGEVTILAIGPMTNLAIALRLRPDIETKIKRLVFMGGAAHVAGNSTKAAEFNFWFDPEAARIVLRSKIPVKVMFGLDICNHALLRKSLFDQIVAVKTPVTKLYEEDFGRRGFPGFLTNPAATAYLWDELAAGYLIDPSFVTKSESVYLDVDTSFSADYGRVVPLDRKLAPDATPVTVMLDLNVEKAYGLYKELLTRPVK
jgi:inosine-uridine nucleoside N-ribohydrolase